MKGLAAAALAGMLFSLKASPAAAQADVPGLLPRPKSVVTLGTCSPLPAGALMSAWRGLAGDRAGSELAEARWRALGISPGPAGRLRIVVRAGGRSAPSEAQSYRLTVDRSGARIEAADADGAFYGWDTLAQLARRVDGNWRVPCVRVEDTPALRWRVLSDDVSRGPLPTMAYFRERIRTLASFKMNGYSPYMEHVFADPKHPLPAPPDGITPLALGELDAYARHYHVALIPEQQSFAHMHETLRWERYAPLAELPHGFLLSPADPAGEAYVRDLIGDELAAVPHPPFFHIGSDEPSDLGRGASRELVAARGEGAVYQQHVVDTANFVIAHGSRPMLWDDALQRHPELFAALPKALVFVNWHYGSEPTYEPYIARIAAGGFEQMIAPGALNWNEIYPDLDAALGNIDRFLSEGKRAHVLGLFQTVWHDDGETLYEATWYPVIYAASSAWETGSVDRARFSRDFPTAFFGSDDPRYASDLASLARCRTLLHDNPRESGDYLFWSDPFDPDLRSVPQRVDLRALRLAAEDALAHLRSVPPPALHPDAAAVMRLAALRYDALGRAFQIAGEARDYYDGARAEIGKNEGYVFRGLNVTKYLFWEQRDTLLGMLPLVQSTWEFESRPGHEQSVLERYHVAAERAIERADRISSATYGYVELKTLPPFDEALGLPATARPR
ncbi:MAG: glycoside hydrolase family 20 zincin-like fold domain-containing protein [Vulcanimicrobiaceae bacterium]